MRNRDTPVRGKVIRENGFLGEEKVTYQCPVCGCESHRMVNYCPNCGQLLDFFEETQKVYMELEAPQDFIPGFCTLCPFCEDHETEYCKYFDMFDSCPVKIKRDTKCV